MPRGVALLAAAAMLVVAAGPADADRLEERPYTAGTGDVLPACAIVPEMTIGGACFRVGAADEPIVRIAGQDEAGTAGYAYRFVTDRPRSLGSGSFCGYSGPLWVPPGASRVLVSALGATGPVFCQGGAPATRGTVRIGHQRVPGELTLAGDAFADGGRIPDRYTCAAPSAPSPALSWSEPPLGTAELALVLEDPDTPIGTYVHWVVYGIDPKAGGIAEGTLPPGAVVGTSYAGPCPPPGDPVHRYIFTLYAISQPTGLGPGASPARLRARMTETLLDQARLTGTYSRL